MNSMLRVSVTGDKSAECPGCKKSQPQAGVHQAQHCKLIFSLCSNLVRPWALGAVWDASMQGHQTITVFWRRCVTKIAKGLKDKTSEEQLRTLGLFSLEKRGLRGVLITPCNFLEEEAEEEVLISLWWPATGYEEIEWSHIEGSSDWTPGKGFSLREWSVTGPVTQGNGWGTKPVRVWGAPRWRF